jgi:hypothetical protein
MGLRGPSDRTCSLRGTAFSIGEKIVARAWMPVQHPEGFIARVITDVRGNYSSVLRAQARACDKTRLPPDGSTVPRPVAPTLSDPAAAVIVSSDRRYWAWRGAAAAGFAIASAFASRTGAGAQALFGLVGGLLFGTFALYAARQLLRRRSRLVLDAQGFVAGDFALGPIPWTEVADVELFGSSEAPFVALVLRDAGPWRARMPAPARLLAGLHRASGLPLLSVSLIGIDHAPWSVVQEARGFWLSRAGEGR